MHKSLPTDTRYYKWTLIEFVERKDKRNRYKVVCECGFVAVRDIRELRLGKSRSCRPCSYIARTGKRASFDAYEIGTQIHNWTIVSMHLSKNKGKIYVCKCKCGFQSEVKQGALTQNKSKACRSCISHERFKTDEVIGKTFGKTKILKAIKTPMRFDRKSKGVYFLAQCLLCKKNRIVRSANIKNYKDNENACNRCAAKKRNENKKAKKDQNIQSDTSI